MGQRMDQKDFDALHRRWYEPPIQEVTPRRRAVDRRVEVAEAANFGAFMGAFNQVRQQTGTG